MSLLAANTRTRPGVVAQLNPVAKLAASAVIALPLIVTLDWVSAAVALALERGLFDPVSVDVVAALRVALPAWLDRHAGELARRIDTSGALSDADEAALLGAMKGLIESHTPAAAPAA